MTTHIPSQCLRLGGTPSPQAAPKVTASRWRYGRCLGPPPPYRWCYGGLVTPGLAKVNTLVVADVHQVLWGGRCSHTLDADLCRPALQCETWRFCHLDSSSGLSTQAHCILQGFTPLTYTALGYPPRLMKACATSRFCLLDLHNSGLPTQNVNKHVRHQGFATLTCTTLGYSPRVMTSLGYPLELCQGLSTLIICHSRFDPSSYVEVYHLDRRPLKARPLKAYPLELRQGLSTLIIRHSRFNPSSCVKVYHLDLDHSRVIPSSYVKVCPP